MEFFMTNGILPGLLDQAFSLVSGDEGRFLVIGGRATNFTEHDDLDRSGRCIFWLGEAEMGDRSFPQGTRVVFLTRWRNARARPVVSKRAEQERVLFIDLDTSTGLFNGWSKRVLASWNERTRAQRQAEQAAADVVAPAPVSTPPVELLAPTPAATPIPVAAAPVVVLQPTEAEDEPRRTAQRNELIAVIFAFGKLDISPEGMREEVDRLFGIVRDLGLPSSRASVQNAFWRARTGRSKNANAESPPPEVATSLAAEPMESEVLATVEPVRLDMMKLVQNRMGELAAAREMVVEAFDGQERALRSLAEGIDLAVRQGREDLAEDAKRQLGVLRDELRQANGQIGRFEIDLADRDAEISRLRRQVDELVAAESLRVNQAAARDAQIAELESRLAVYKRIEGMNPLVKTLRETVEAIDRASATTKPTA